MKKSHKPIPKPEFAEQEALMMEAERVERVEARQLIVEKANDLRNVRLNTPILGMRHINRAVFRLRQRQPGQHDALLRTSGFNTK